MTMTFENAPKEVIDIAIDMMIIANPTMELSREECIERLMKMDKKLLSRLLEILNP